MSAVPNRRARNRRGQRDATIKLRLPTTDPRATPQRSRRPASGVVEHYPATPAKENPDWIDLREAGASLAVCNASGEILSLSPSAARIFRGVGVEIRPLPVKVPPLLWEMCQHTNMGEMSEWRPSRHPGVCLGFTPYKLGDNRLLLLLSDIQGKQQQVSARLHKQRLELTGRLVAMIAHDLRVPLSTILFNADLVHSDMNYPEHDRTRGLARSELAASLRDIRESADRMRASIEGLLDFAGPGGARCGRVELGATLERLHSLVYPILREGQHELQFQVDESAAWSKTNALLLEHVLVNLVTNAVEASTVPIAIEIVATVVEPTQVPELGFLHSNTAYIRLSVQDSGPGIPEAQRGRVFDPFFSTKPHGTGLGLPMAREAMAAIGAGLTLETSTKGAVFVIWLPVSTGNSWSPPNLETTQ